MIPQSWTDAVGLSQHAYHVQAVLARRRSPASRTLVGIALLIYRRRTTGPVFMATTRNDKLMYVVLVAGDRRGAVRHRCSGPASSARSTTTARPCRCGSGRSGCCSRDGDLMAAAPLYFQVHVLIGLALFALWPFTRLVHAFSAPIGYLFRPYVVYRSRDVARPRTSGGVAATPPGLVTTSWLRRESAVGDASSEADSGQCNFRGCGGCHAEWIPVLEVGAAGVVRPGV